MNPSRAGLLIIAFIALSILAGAYYLQHIEGLAPCPLCILQRYAFAMIAIVCLVATVLPSKGLQRGLILAVIVAVAGAGTALWHLWVIASPTVSCGRDVLEAPLNALPPAQWWPEMFQADAYAVCSMSTEPLLGLSIPAWSLCGFCGLLLMLLFVLLKCPRHVPSNTH